MVDLKLADRPRLEVEMIDHNFGMVDLKLADRPRLEVEMIDQNLGW